MSEVSQTWFQLTLLDQDNGTSSPALPAGPPRSDSPVSATMPTSGRDRVRASRSAMPGGAAESPTIATSGQLGSVSSASAVLQCSLVSKLRVELASGGSTLYSLTWKERATPALRQICQLQASVLRTSDSGCSSWPTASARDWKSSASNKHGDNSRPLNEVARLAVWPTPRACDGPKGSTADKPDRAEGPDLPTVAGLTATGSPALTASRGQLNPEHTRFLMGYPAAWGSCADTATRSSRMSRRPLSGRR